MNAAALSVGALLQSAWRRRWLIACITFGLTAFDLFAAKLLPPSYRAEVLMQVDRRAGRGVDGNVAALEPELDGGALVGQAEIIRSPALALDIITSQNLLAQHDFDKLREKFERDETSRGWLGQAFYRVRRAIADLLPSDLGERLAPTVPREEPSSPPGGRKPPSGPSRSA